MDKILNQDTEINLIEWEETLNSPENYFVYDTNKNLQKIKKQVFFLNYSTFSVLDLNGREQKQFWKDLRNNPRILISPAMKIRKETEFLYKFVISDIFLNKNPEIVLNNLNSFWHHTKKSNTSFDRAVYLQLNGKFTASVNTTPEWTDNFLKKIATPEFEQLQDYIFDVLQKHNKKNHNANTACVTLEKTLLINKEIKAVSPEILNQKSNKLKIF